MPLSPARSSSAASIVASVWTWKCGIVACARPSAGRSPAAGGWAPGLRRRRRWTTTSGADGDLCRRAARDHRRLRDPRGGKDVGAGDPAPRARPLDALRGRSWCSRRRRVWPAGCACDARCATVTAGTGAVGRRCGRRLVARCARDRSRSGARPRLGRCRPLRRRRRRGRSPRRPERLLPSAATISSMPVGLGGVGHRRLVGLDLDEVLARVDGVAVALQPRRGSCPPPSSPTAAAS